MTALFITNNNLTTSTESLSWFKSFCSEPNDLIIRYEISKANVFIENSLVNEKQKHIDFIVSDWSFGNENIKVLLEWIRNSDKQFSSNNFQLRSIPFLLINDSKNTFVSEGFDGIIDGFPNELWRFDSKIKSAIKEWRYNIAVDLDLIGLDPKTQNEYKNYRKNFISYHRLKVLTRSFVDKKSKKLNYIWTSQNIEELNNANDKFNNMIQKTIKNPRAFQKKTIMTFLKKIQH